MKIRPSLRLYVLLVVLLTGIVTILTLSVLSVHYFISGMDVAMRGAMFAQARSETVADNKPYSYQEFTVATRWQDLPAVIQQSLVEEEVGFQELTKSIHGKSIFTPPEAGYFAMKVMKGDDVRFVSAVFERDKSTFFQVEGVPHFIIILATALGAIVLFSSVLILAMRKVASPVERLREWAKSLDKDKLAEPVPDFLFSELNTLANLVRNSLSSVQEGLAREQEFLGYASHELRTPISVTRTNTELLEKMILKGLSQEKQLEVVERIKRAGYTMTDLTETLLWLTRQEGKELPEDKMSVGLVVEQLVHDLEYLTKGKSVEVTVTTDSAEQFLPESLCRIVLSNLIRNALQHTSEGSVEINQIGNQVTILNQNLNGSIDDNNLGFGLGLELTNRLVSQYGWHYHNQELENGRRVVVKFLAED
ncbi:HAMP domain-containing histidine kinase [Vibrio sp. T187]|uniref:sensor histidine kinase n=1 Tax=Vibrio TaxID=662 RepID=UPI0010C9B186|nr:MULTISPECIES: HAMP domain-containing sensor histidine kinase [Vibrio]MBW3695916.1 HAMP domain-containing histidine kinase [Vibrio sp. T187]